MTPPQVVGGPTLLTGLIHCAKCSGAMTIRTGKGGRYRYYACSTRARQGPTACAGMAVPMEKLDALVANHLEKRLLDPKRLEEVLATVLDRRQERTGRRSSARPEQFVEQIAEPRIEYINLGLRDRHAFGPVVRDGPFFNVVLGRAAKICHGHPGVIMEVEGLCVRKDAPPVFVPAPDVLLFHPCRIVCCACGSNGANPRHGALCITGGI